MKNKLHSSITRKPENLSRSNEY